MLRTEHQVNVSMNQTADMRLINGIYADTVNSASYTSPYLTAKAIPAGWRGIVHCAEFTLKEPPAQDLIVFLRRSRAFN